MRVRIDLTLDVLLYATLVAEACVEGVALEDHLVVGERRVAGLHVDAVVKGLVIRLFEQMTPEIIVRVEPQFSLVPIIEGFIAFAGFRKFQVLVRRVLFIVLLKIQRVTAWIICSHDAGVLDELVLAFSEAFEFA